MNRREILQITIGVFLVLCLYYVAKWERIPDYKAVHGNQFNLEGETRPTNSKLYRNKWVVMTSINYPTDVVKKLAALPGWSVVVVGDKKTPADWKQPGVEYLSAADQEKLGYEMVKLLPWNHYGRKNIGYLYAISKGADLIYETDDDNILAQEGVVVFPETINALTYRPQHEPVLNPYSYFGYPSVWPRGYPLEHIGASKLHPMDLELQRVNMSIQQGLADLDPDVDAIFRLTRSEDLKKIRFHDRHPVVIPTGKMCPFNSQNTLFHKSAFWGLLIPITTTFRVCDIWRGWWVQRLLWDVGANLGFTAPSAVQDRNPHNYLKDMEDEQDLYFKGGDLVQFLIDWRSTNPSFFGRMEELATAMEEKQYWKQGDVDLVKAWIRDLKKVGYTPPRIVN